MTLPIKTEPVTAGTDAMVGIQYECTSDEYVHILYTV